MEEKLSVPEMYMQKYVNLSYLYTVSAPHCDLTCQEVCYSSQYMFYFILWAISYHNFFGRGNKSLVARKIRIQ